MDKKVDEIIRLVVQMIVYWFVAVGLHEMGHFFVAKWLGYEASVTYPNMAKGYTTVVGLSRGSVDGLLIGLAGGYFVVLLFIPLSIISKRFMTDLAINWFIVMDFMYGTAEGLYFYKILPEWSMSVSLVLACPILLLLLYKNDDWHLFGSGDDLLKQD